jgi:hypothetical protein
MNFAADTGHALFELAPGLFGRELGMLEITCWIEFQKIRREENRQEE